jgi:hypothetical protein
MAKEVKNESVESEIATAVTDAVAEVVDTSGAQKSEEKLDAQAELFVRRITDSVTKAMADILRPTPTDETDDEEEDSPVKRKRRKTVPITTPKPKSATFLGRLGF